MDDRHRLGRGGNDLGRGLAAITRRRGSIGEWTNTPTGFSSTGSALFKVVRFTWTHPVSRRSYKQCIIP
jgi:hypothetical protein